MISFYFSEAIKSFFRAKFATVITILTIAISALFVTLSVYLLFRSGRITNYLKEKIEITLFLKNDAPEGAVFKLRRKLKQDKRIKSVAFVSKEQASGEMSDYLGIEITGALNENPLPASFSITVNPKLNSAQIKKLIKDFKKEPYVDDVIFDRQLLDKLLKGVSYVKIFVYSLAAITLLLSLYLMIVVNKFTIERRKNIFEIMKLVGAKLSMIRMPVFLSAVILGVISSVIGSAFILLVVTTIEKFGAPLFGGKKNLLLLNILISVILGILGGLFSIKNININFTHKNKFN